MVSNEWSTPLSSTESQYNVFAVLTEKKTIFMVYFLFMPHTARAIAVAAAAAVALAHSYVCRNP